MCTNYNILNKITTRPVSLVSDRNKMKYAANVNNIFSSLIQGNAHGRGW